MCIKIINVKFANIKIVEWKVPWSKISLDYTFNYSLSENDENYIRWMHDFRITELNSVSSLSHLISCQKKSYSKFEYHLYTHMKESRIRFMIQNMWRYLSLFFLWNYFLLIQLLANIITFFISFDHTQRNRNLWEL